MSCARDYNDFLVGKTPTVPYVGFEPLPFTAPLFDWQRAVVSRALRAGRHALFADCGLGKGPMSLEWSHQAARHTNGQALIVAPLAVAQQFVREAAKFGLPCSYARNQGEVTGPVTVTNYERLDSFRPEAFAAVALDESSALKAFSGKVKRQLVEAFRATPYRLACTATPAPNDVVELGNHAEFLGLMPSSEMLARWFINDSGEAGAYRLKKHAEADFWRWVASWAVALGKPSDLLDADGQPYADGGYTLPPLITAEHVVQADGAGPRDGQLFRNVTASATTLHRELRQSLPERVAKAAEVVRAEPDEAWVLWCTTNEEADALAAVLPEATEVRGSMDADEKSRLLEGFSTGAFRWLITKGGLAGLGMNWQHCARHVKLASNFSFEEFYQEARRSWRFGQTRPVHVHVICASGEERIREAVASKQAAHELQRERMVAAQREVQLEALAQRRAGVGSAHLTTREGTGWKLHHGDCVEVTRALPTDSVGMVLFSPPFSSLYVYSASLRDMGNCRDDAEFFTHYDYLTPELLRILKPGRIAVVHCKDLPDYRVSGGAVGLRDFPGELVRHMEGVRLPDGTRWKYASRVTLWKSPVTEMHKTKSHGLLYKTLRENASFSRQGLPDYLLVFRKVVPGDECPEPVTHTREDFPLEDWQDYASPVWMDVDHTDTLNVAIARAGDDEKHLAPLPLPVVERSVRLWSNTGDVVFSPFGGIGSEGVGALRMGRRFEGVELKDTYFARACRNLDAATAQGDLFAGGAR
ncbi:DNA methyltransferase [Corallococcus sp. 4LFB]|uniref:DNA methyltransferase n=1 Tax=Corallococcus sp. 4LFB TaxID=3383249 RepID=UPI003974E5C2